MNRMRGIGFETQLAEALGTVPDDVLRDIEKAVADKARWVTENIDRVVMVNGSRVFYPRVNGEDICYLLSDGGPGYYYPIRFADIVLKGDDDECE